MKPMIILINCPIRLSSSKFGSYRVPLGLLYLEASLRENGFKAELIDFQRHDISWEDVYHKIECVNNCLIGFTCDSDNIFRVINASNRLLNRYDHISVILGGPHVSCWPESYVNQRRIIVRDEGEYPMVLLAKHFLEHKGKLEDIPGITYLAKGCIKSNPISYGPYQNLNNVPFPDYSTIKDFQFDGKPYSLSITTSRGCMYDCYFCSEGRNQHKYRPRSIENIKQELSVLKKLYNSDLPYLCFVDDTFTASSKRVEQICDVLDELFPEKENFGFFCEGRVNILSENPSLVQRMVKAGLQRLQIGIESGSQEMLDRINKKTRISQIEHVVKLCEKFNVPTVFGAFICGLPNQTEDDVKADIGFAKKLIDIAPGRIELKMAILTPLPGTEFQINASKWGLSIFDPNFVTGMVTEDCFADTSCLSQDRIIKLYQLFEQQVDRYSLQKSLELPAKKIKDICLLSVKRSLFPLIVRQLCKIGHASWIFLMRGRKDHFFLHEIPKHERQWAFPVKSNSNKIIKFNGDFLINEKSPLSLLITKDEFQYYQYFCGKLTFENIAKKVSKDIGLAEIETLNKCLGVYKKCEDKFAAITMV